MRNHLVSLILVLTCLLGLLMLSGCGENPLIPTTGSDETLGLALSPTTTVLADTTTVTPLGDPDPPKKRPDDPPKEIVQDTWGGLKTRWSN